MKSFRFYFIYVFFLASIFLFSFPELCFAAYPKLITTLTLAFETVETWLLRIATPAAAVSVGTGIFMKKFSFGDEERIRTGKKIVRGTLFSYAFLLSIDLILSAIKLLLT